MTKVFLDTNVFVDAVHRAPEKQTLDQLLGHLLYISTLSFHIYCYTFKIKVPNSNVLVQKENFQIVDFTSDLLEKALHGPTDDLEDNIQLNTATDAKRLFLDSRQKTFNQKLFWLHAHRPKSLSTKMRRKTQRPDTIDKLLLIDISICVKSDFVL